MNNKSKKTAFVLIGILAFSLVAGNVLLANDFGPVTGIVATADLEFLANGLNGTPVAGERYKQDLSLGILSQDLEFVSQPFSRDRLPSSGAVYSEYTGSDIVNGTDINFVRSGVFGSDLSNLVCVVDGVQVTGKLCVN